MITVTVCNRFVLLVAICVLSRTDGRSNPDWLQWEEQAELGLGGRQNVQGNVFRNADIYDDDIDDDIDETNVEDADVHDDYESGGQRVDMVELPSVRPGVRLYKSGNKLYEYDFNGFPQEVQSIFDPSMFTGDIVRCQATCGDTYFNCCFYECPSDDTGARKKDTSLGSKLLKFLSLGLIKPDTDEYKEPACFRMCRQKFRTCYTSCICDHNGDLGKYLCK